jgi:hypothetical protein
MSVDCGISTLGPSQFEMQPCQDAAIRKAIQKAIQYFFSTHANAGIIQLQRMRGKRLCLLIVD